MQIVIEENSYIERFLNKHSRYSQELIQEINDNILTMINDKHYKIKTVGKLKYRGQTIFEYKIALDKSFVCRVAYIKEENQITVFYISTNIIKVNFTKEVHNLKGVSGK